jgi:uncharacterized protein YbjT (DUF2867 family)
MKILIYGATGMIGQGVLRECLAASDVSQVTVVGRTAVVQEHPKLIQLIQPDLMNLEPVENKLQGFEACFFCLGVSSSGMSEDAYRHITYDVTLAVAKVLARLTPAMTFTYVSGAGTDGTECGASMRARIKGKTENDLMKLPFAGVYLFRPAVIQPLHGIKSKTPVYQWFYSITKPFLSIAHRLFPSFVVTTEEMGQAMLNAARRGSGRVVLESKDIAQMAL